MHAPSLRTFEQLARDFQIVPVQRRLLSDVLTPVTAFARLDTGGPAGLFESVIGGEKVGRYSFLVVDPVGRLSARQHVVRQEWHGQTSSFEHEDPLQLLEDLIGNQRVAPLPQQPPFVGGAIGYAGYDVVRYTERLPHAPRDDRQLPDLDFSFYNSVVVFDNANKTLSVIALARPGEHASAADAYRSACEQIDRLVTRLTSSDSDAGTALGTPDVPDESPTSALPVTSNFTREQFHAAVRRCVEYIRAGDIFQVVPSQRFTVQAAVAPLEIYRSLRVVNPSPFMFFLRTPDTTLVGCSPEIMCRVNDGIVTVRPLAGTRPRGRDDGDDQRLEAELLADPKERAEHVMLVDLGRNDVGRVAQFGSIELPELMVVERYSHVMHISSEVRGRLRPGLTAFDALRACLPAGTVSGAPKVRAMEIIDEVEPLRRGPYGGAVGYFDYRGNMDTCIALRTMVVRPDQIDVQAGCGVVADSDPEAEYQETVNKARAMIRAIELTAARLQPEPSVSDGPRDDHRAAR
jgi:anthranilate synthase component 1